MQQPEKQIIPIPAAADLPFVTFLGSDLAKMKSFKWNGSFFGGQDVIPIRTSRVCQLGAPEGRIGAVLAIIISLKWSWKLLGKFAEM